MDKSKIYLDLSKCTEEQQKHVFLILPPEPHRDAYDIFGSYKYLQFIPKSKFQEKEKWMVDKQAFDKVELTYPEFIKLFEEDTCPKCRTKDFGNCHSIKCPMRKYELFDGGERKEVLQVEKSKASSFILEQIDKKLEQINEIDIAHTEGVLIGLKICKEMWAQGTISHENIQEEIYHYQEELDNLNSNQ